MAAGRKNSKQQFTKFTGTEVLVKKNVRSARLAKGFFINRAAHELGLSRKQLEDIETVRNYGSFVKINMLAAMAKLYEKPISYFFAKNRA